jgi:RNA binding exosome subunit
LARPAGFEPATMGFLLDVYPKTHALSRLSHGRNKVHKMLQDIYVCLDLDNPDNGVNIADLYINIFIPLEWNTRLRLRCMSVEQESKAYPFRGVEISVFAHATEEEAKVERAVLNLFPHETADIRKRYESLTGYYNDPIKVLKFSSSKRRSASDLFVAILLSLTSLDRERLSDEIDDRLDKAGNLYIRFDKQSAFRRKVTFGEVDSIRIKFMIRVPHGVRPREAALSIITDIIDQRTSQ